MGFQPHGNTITKQIIQMAFVNNSILRPVFKTGVIVKTHHIDNLPCKCVVVRLEVHSCSENAMGVRFPSNRIETGMVSAQFSEICFILRGRN
jgi:hypothetical protein